MEITENQALIIFAKNLEKGKVKKRLAKDLGNQKALELYQEFCVHTMTNTFDIPGRRMLFYSEFIQNGDIWGSDDYMKFVQNGENLGQRMAEAFKLAFDKSEKVVIIGTDCMELTRNIIMEAFDRLEQDDIVLGPANDGGYYLLGMNSFHPELFENIDWSTEKVLEQTKARIEPLNLSVFELPELIDIDTVEDLENSLAYGNI